MAYLEFEIPIRSWNSNERGFLAEDVQFVLNAAYVYGLNHQYTAEESNWLSLIFIKP